LYYLVMLVKLIASLAKNFILRDRTISPRRQTRWKPG
jgi:hypothetical protein